MVKRCCVYQCRTTGRNLHRPDRRLSLHSFPRRDRSPTRYRKWSIKVGRKDFVPTPKSVVCSEHFVEEDFTLTSRLQMRLMPGAKKAVLEHTAVPSLRLGEAADQCPARRRSKYIEAKERRELLEEIPWPAEAEWIRTRIVGPEVVVITPDLLHPSPFPPPCVVDAHAQCDMGMETLANVRVTDVDARKSRTDACVTDVDARKSRTDACVTNVDARKSRTDACVTNVDACKSRAYACVTDVDAHKSRADACVRTGDTRKSPANTSVSDVDTLKRMFPAGRVQLRT